VTGSPDVKGEQPSCKASNVLDAPAEEDAGSELTSSDAPDVDLPEPPASTRGVSDLEQVGKSSATNLAAAFAQGPAFKNLEQLGKLTTANLAANFAQGPAFKNLEQLGKLTTANLAANFAQGPAFKNLEQLGKLTTANLAANFAQGPAFKNLGQLGQTSASEQVARAVTVALTQQVDNSRHARVVDSSYLSSLMDSAVAAEPDFDAQATLGRTIKRVASEPLPLAEDRLLTDEEEVVEAWVALLVQQFMEATGLSERDLLEDAVATLAYSSVLALAVALLVNFPVMLLVSGATGFAGKDPAMYVSRLARRGFRLLNTL
jgi:hypothetical protein